MIIHHQTETENERDWDKFIQYNISVANSLVGSDTRILPESKFDSRRH